MTIPQAILAIFIAWLALLGVIAWMLSRADEMAPADHDGLSDEERAAFAILREAGE